MDKFIDWVSSCGRIHLVIGGYVVATEGDRCRDPDVGVEIWTDEAIKLLVEVLQKKMEAPHG